MAVCYNDCHCRATLYSLWLGICAGRAIRGCFGINDVLALESDDQINGSAAGWRSASLQRFMDVALHSENDFGVSFFRLRNRFFEATAAADGDYLLVGIFGLLDGLEV